MKTSLLITAFALMACFQSLAQKNIIDALQSRVENEGSVTVVCASAISDLLGSPSLQKETTASQQQSVSANVSGYRIVVFMGNNAGKSRSEAAHRQAAIQERFPDLTTYVRYEAPNWKVFAGDFLSQEAAAAKRRDLQRAFPEFGREMFVVADKVVINQMH
jgi:hypothetical protein